MRELRFAEFRIDLEQMRLYRGDVRISIGRKTLDALLFLIENKSHLVTRQSLHRYIWASERISSSTIPMCITEIRKALDDDAKAPCFIASTKGRGYQFVADVTLHTDASPASDPHAEFPFIGRRTALVGLQDTVRQTRIDLQGRTISILGEAGVGKSRLLAELLTRSAPDFDFIVARTNSTSPNAAYSIWTHALRTALEKYPENDTLRQNADQIASVLPEVHIGTSTPRPNVKIDQTLFYLHWSNAFRCLARQRPLLIALEDFHQADDDSVALLEHMCVELSSSPILFIIVARPSLLTRSHSRTRPSHLTFIHQTPIQLSPFTIDEVSNFIDPFEDNRESITQEIFKQTAGNAFYVTRLLRMGRKEQAGPIRYTWQEMAAADAAEIVSKQIGDLPESTRVALETASVVGHVFQPSIVAQTLGISIPELLEDLDPAHAARVIQRDGPDLTFCHSILLESLYRSISPRHRLELHARIARTMRQCTQTNSWSSTTIFFHLGQAYPVASASEIASAALRAGSDATARLAFHDAARIFDSSLEILSREPVADPIAQIEILVHRASAMYYLGHGDQARASLLEGADWARRIDSPELLTKCALAMAPDFLSIEVGSYDSDQEMLLRESLDRLPDDAYALRARALARLSQISKWKWSHADEAMSLATRAYDLARTSADSDALVAALSARADAAHGPDRTDERIQHILALQEATLARSDTYSFLLQQTRLIAALLERGEIRRLRLENDRYRSIAEKIGLPQYRWYPVSTDSMLMCLEGNLEEAERLADQYKKLAGSSPDQNLVQTYACQAVLRGIDRDQSHQVLSLVEAFANEKRSVLSWAAGLAWLQWDSGRHDAARETLRQFADADIERLFREPGGTIGVGSLAEACAYVGDRRQARFLYELIAPVRGRFAMAGYGVAYFGTMARYASILAIALREFEQARRLSAQAVMQEQSTGSRSWLVYAMLDEIRAKEEALEIRNGISTSAIREFRRLSIPGLDRANRLIIAASSSDSIETQQECL